MLHCRSHTPIAYHLAGYIVIIYNNQIKKVVYITPYKILTSTIIHSVSNNTSATLLNIFIILSIRVQRYNFFFYLPNPIGLGAGENKRAPAPFVKYNKPSVPAILTKYCKGIP